MYTETAHLYDLVYSWKDYQAEVTLLRRLVGRAGGTLLDVACGTGRHLELLAPHYRVEGVDLDPAMVRIARSRDLVVQQGDLRALDLGRRFDVVTCLFGSIAYVRDLDAAVANLARHVAPGGVVAVEPWLTPDRVATVLTSLDTAETHVKIALMTTVEARGRMSVLNVHYLIGRAGGIEHGTERHYLWLWTLEEYAEAFRRSGLEPHYDATGLMGRGLWLGAAAG